MKKSITILFIALSFAIAQAQSSEKIKGNGNISTKEIATSDYDKVAVTGFFDVELVSGNEGKISIKGEENLLEHIRIDVNDNTLTIATEKGKRISPSTGKTITITVPFESLSEVNLSGSGDISSKNTIKSAKFATTLTGSGDLHLDIEAQEVTATLTGSGDLILKGKTEAFTSTLTGSGDLNASRLQSGDVTSNVSGSGDCKVYCSDSLYARVSGSGAIYYAGDPKKKDTKVHGSGSISKA
jgi:hypothetical protein